MGLYRFIQAVGRSVDNLYLLPEHSLFLQVLLPEYSFTKYCGMKCCDIFISYFD